MSSHRICTVIIFVTRIFQFFSHFGNFRYNRIDIENLPTSDCFINKKKPDLLDTNLIKQTSSEDYQDEVFYWDVYHYYFVSEKPKSWRTFKSQHEGSSSGSLCYELRSLSRMNSLKSWPWNLNDMLSKGDRNRGEREVPKAEKLTITDQPTRHGSWVHILIQRSKSTCVSRTGVESAYRTQLRDKKKMKKWQIDSGRAFSGSSVDILANSVAS